MRIAVASFVQETDSFSPLLTTLDDFRQQGLHFGEEVLEKARGVGGPIDGFLAVAEEEGGITPVPIFLGNALAGGPMSDEAVEFFRANLVEGLRRALPLDGAFLFLHGAAASETMDDVVGYLLAAMREVLGEGLPVVMPCDHHANITRRIVALTNAIVGYRTQPHDQFDTGQRAAKLLFRLVRGEIHPTTAWRKIPLIAHQEQFLTTSGPMKEWFDLARQFEALPGVLSISNFPMQPWLDVAEGGWATVVITDGDQALAERLAGELADKAWALRERFREMTSIPPEEAVRRAVEAPKGLVVLSDTGDSVFGGSTGDSTAILREMLQQKVPCMALVPMLDPEVVSQAIAVGVGNKLTTHLGAKFDRLFNAPVELTARVAAIAEGRLRAGVVGLESFDMGRTALLEAGAIKIVVSEYRGIGGNHPAVYRRFGIEPAEAKMVVLKTASNFQYYKEMTSAVLRVDSPGLTSSHLERFPWRKLPRPIYPFDELRHWTGQSGNHSISKR